ncbi:sigma-E factor negative regulatory protein [Vogesella facilis]|uniref:Sigma-E factor negative regulatory protein n=1 Tax=Vogesella facilis TaxID=1655232 RepID=A0ABV7RJ52_9NEIS
MMKENLSALMDGELADEDAAPLIKRLAGDAELQTAWQEFHLIGDAMRGASLLSVDVRAEVSDRLAAEPTVLAPRPLQRRASRPAARFAVAASVALAGVVGWYNWQSQPADAGLVAEAVPAPAALVQVAADGRQSYLDAHQDGAVGEGLTRVGLTQPAAQGVR